MQRKDIDRRVLIITRVICFVVGAVVGWTAMWQFLVAFPELVRPPLWIVFELIAALVIAAALTLSARPIIYLGKLIGQGVGKLAARLKPMEVVGIVLGLVAGLMVAFLAYVLMNLFIPIAAVRIVLTVIIAFAACIGASIAFARGLTETAVEEEEEPVELRYNGMIVHSSAFRSEHLGRILDWFDGPVYVLGRTVKTLIDGMEADAESLARYRDLAAQDVFRQVETPEVDETQAVIRYAVSKRLKIVLCGADDAFARTPVKLLDLQSL